MAVALTFCLQVALLAAEAVSATPVSSPPSAPGVAQAEPEASFATPTRLDRIGRVVAPVMIDGKGPFRLVVDTGASHSTFSPQLVAALGLAPSFDAPVLLNGVTGVAQVPTVTVARMQAGDMVVKDAQVPVLLSSIMVGADGILGVAGLRNQRILVDFRHDRVLITHGAHSIDTGGFLRIRGRKVAGGLLMVDARVGGVKVRAVVDTGAERTLGNAALRDALRVKQRGRGGPRWADTEVYGATTDVANGESSVAPPIKLGSAVVKGTEVVYGDFHIFKVWHLESRPAALIGMDVLGTAGAIVIDYARRELYLDVRPPREMRADHAGSGPTPVAQGEFCVRSAGATRVRSESCR
jgi:predicted aspartyl protease